MILSDQELRSAMLWERLLVTPLPRDEDIQPASVDLHLGSTLLRMRRSSHQMSIDPRDPQEDAWFEDEPYDIGRGDRGWRLQSREFALACTVEHWVFPPIFGGSIEGKSSVGRLGLQVHVTAGFFDPGFRGFPTLELLNVTDRPMILVEGMKIAQMAVHRMGSPSVKPYGSNGSKYQDQPGKPVPSRFHLNYAPPDSG